MHGFALSNVFELSDQLKAMGAIRYDHYSYRTADTEAKDGKRRYDAPASDAYEKSSADAVSYRVGLVYLPTEALSFYASLGSFYIPDKTTSFNPARERLYNKQGQAITGRNRGGAFFDPQTGYQFEVGTKYTLNDVLQLNLSAYHIRRNNEVANTFTFEEVDGQPQDIFVQAQVGATEGNGFETDLTYRPLPGLELTAGYSYTDIHIADTRDTPITSQLNLREGTPMSWVPRKQFFTLGSYAFQRGPLRNLELNYSLSYRDKMYYNVGRGETFAPFTQLDLGASYQLPQGFSLSLQVRNLLGTKEYVSEVSGTQLIPNEPTNALVTLSYRL